MRLYLIRHPQPADAADLCYGATDVPVTTEQMEAAVSALAALLPRRVPLYSSPLLRCAQLAEKLAMLLDASPPAYDSRLAEMNFGRWEMQPWVGIPRSEIDAWANDLQYFRPGGGENVVEAARRVLAFAEDMESRATQSAIIVCHAGTIRLLLACRSEKEPEAAALLAAKNTRRFGYGECVAFDW